MFLLVLLHSFGLKIGGYAHFSVSTTEIKKLEAKNGNPKNFFPYEMALHIRLVKNGVLLKSINFGILAIFSHFLAKRVNFWAYVTKSANGIVFFEFLILKLVYISREKLWTLKCTQNPLRS